MVVAHHRRDRGREPRDRGDQRLGDARRHHHQRRRALRSNVEKRAHDAPHRAHEADEGRHAARGGEEADVALERRGLLARRAVHRALRDLIAQRLRRPARGMLIERLLAVDHDAREEAVGMLLHQQPEIRPRRQPAEVAEERAILALDTAIEPDAAPDDRPGIDGDDEQDQEDGLGERPRAHDQGGDGGSASSGKLQDQTSHQHALHTPCEGHGPDRLRRRPGNSNCQTYKRFGR